MSLKHPNMRKVAVGLAFLTPNILGFLAFTLIPLVFSLVMAFTNWDLRYHNQFQSETIRFTGLDNFIRLFGDERFWRYLGNTLFLMMVIPVSMAGSLAAALLLRHSLAKPQGKKWGMAVTGTIFFAALLVLILLGMGGVSTIVLVGGIAGLILFGGTVGGNTLYRTLFYTPHFTAGVATFVLWKKLYNPTSGPVNAVIDPPLRMIESAVRALPPSAGTAAMAVMGIAVAAILAWGFVILRRKWREADIGTGSLLMGILLLALPAGVVWTFLPSRMLAVLVAALYGLGAIFTLVLPGFGRRYERCPAWKGSGFTLLIFLALGVAGAIAVGFARIAFHLPEMAVAGLNSPAWLTDYDWAKPALMIMGLWAAIGSNNMILYLAGLSNVSVELEDAAKIDGATPWQMFWAVTWPQLAPVTFFIFIMSIIGGLQGGFEMARVMTQGGPAGSTTTLSYYIFIEGFETGRLGFASAVAWVLFAIVLLITLVNFRFGSRYTNE